MFHARYILTVFGLATMLSFIACAREAPEAGGDLKEVIPVVDLIPVKDRPDIEGPVGFCKRDEEGLIVTVKNQGDNSTNNAFVQVEFFPGGLSPLIDLGSISANSFGGTTFEIPSECWDPDCDFKILVDPNNTVAESNEGNNTADGRCIG